MGFTWRHRLTSPSTPSGPPSQGRSPLQFPSENRHFFQPAAPLQPPGGLEGERDSGGDWHPAEPRLAPGSRKQQQPTATQPAAVAAKAAVAVAVAVDSEVSEGE